MFIYKKLKASDANTIAFEAHKEYNIDKDNTASLGVSLLDSSYSSASRDTYSLFDINNHKQYFQLDHLFYKDALFNYGNLIGGIDYNNQEKRLYDKATIISLSQKTFGSGVQKGTFLFNNTYKDDSLGNLYVKNDILSNYPQDKERVFYLAPVKGFKSVDLTRDPNTGEPIVNAATSYNSLKLDDSLYINPVEYISCSFARNTTLNCTEVDLTNGYIKAPNSNNYNFGNEDFTISFYYKNRAIADPKYILAKSKTQTVVEYPESNLDGSLRNTHGSASLLQPKEVDAGKSFPFEVAIKNSKLEFRRSDQDTLSFITGSSGAIANNGLCHVACVKSGSKLKLYIDGIQNGADQPDNTNLCQNKADLFIGTDPTISSSKLDNTENQQISQLMIWNKALSTTEIANVSESIDGSPYVGNIFYENGIATLTSPKVNDGTLTSLEDFTGDITLNNTSFTQGSGTTTTFQTPTFSGSLTFTSSREQLEADNMSTVFNNLIFDSTYVSASLNSTTVSLVSKPYALLDDYIIKTIQSETFDTYDSYAELNPIVDAIPGGIGTGSGDRGTDGDSITATEEITFIGEGVFLAENQTVTASFDIDPVSPSNIINEEWFVAGGSGGNAPINTDNLVAETDFKLRGVGTNENDGGVVSGELLSPTDGEIAVTGSNGFVSLFTDASTDGITGTGTLPSIASPSYGAGIQMIGSATGQVNILGIGANGVSGNTNGWAGVAAFTNNTNLDSSAFPGNFTNTDAVSVTNGRFEFGPAVEDGDGGFKKFYKKPGNLRFKVSITARENGGQYSVNPVYRFNNGGAPSGPWFSLNSAFIEQADGSAGANEQNLGSSFAEKIWYINVPANQGWYNQNGDQLEFGVAFNEYNEGNVKVQQISAVLVSQEESAGFKDKLALETEQQTFAAGSIVEYTFNDINIKDTNSNLLTRSLDTNARGTTTNELDYNASGPDDTDSQLWIKLYGPVVTTPAYLSDTVPLIASHNYNSTNSPQILTNTVQLPEAGDYFWRVYIGDSSANALFTRAYVGFSLNEVLIRKWEPTSVYDISNYVGPGGSTHTEFGTNTNTDGETFDQSVNFDNDSFIQDGSVPTSIYNFSNTTSIGFAGNILITSSLGSTASFDQGNFISGSASIDITGTKGLYKVENVTLGTNNTSGFVGNTTGISPTQKIRIQTKKNGTLQDTKYVEENAVSQNAFEADTDKLNLGLLDNTDNVSFEFTVVDSSNNVDKVTKHQGFNIQEIQLSKITSSNEVTQVNDGTFPANLDALYFSSSHINVGDASMPFTTGQVTASIASISADGTTITLNDDLLITSSLGGDLFHVSGAENGPFIISASLPVTTQLTGNDKEYQVIESFIADPSPSQDPGANEGLAYHLLAGNNIISNVFVDPPNTTISGPTTYRNFSPYNPKTQQYNFFVSGVASPLYPEGVITSSAGIDYTCSFQFTYALSAISGSNISSGDTFTAEEFAPFTSYASTLLRLTSSHTTDPHVPNTPLYTLEKQDISIVDRTSDGHIKVNQTLFITASSEATGSSLSSSTTPGDYTFTPENPIGATGVTSDMLGGTFNFTDLGTLQTSEYQITAINGNEITLNNLDGGSNAIQTVDENNLTNTPEVTVEYSQTVANDFTIQYKNSHLIFENEFHCTVDEDEYNFSLNPTARKNKDINKGDLANFATGSNFKPYVTTVGLYNEAGELLVVGKLGQPVRMSDETDTTFVVRYDT